jgi:hypothetical protein
MNTTTNFSQHAWNLAASVSMHSLSASQRTGYETSRTVDCAMARLQYAHRVWLMARKNWAHVTVDPANLCDAVRAFITLWHTNRKPLQSSPNKEESGWRCYLSKSTRRRKLRERRRRRKQRIQHGPTPPQHRLQNRTGNSRRGWDCDSHHWKRIV